MQPLRHPAVHQHPRDASGASGGAARAEALPPVVLKGRGWGRAGTHISALHDDALWEVLRRLPPRALVRAGLVRGSMCVRVCIYVCVYTCVGGGGVEGACMFVRDCGCMCVGVWAWMWVLVRVCMQV